MPNADADGLAELYFGKRSDARLQRVRDSRVCVVLVMPDEHDGEKYEMLVSKSGGMNCAPAA